MMLLIENEEQYAVSPLGSTLQKARWHAAENSVGLAEAGRERRARMLRMMVESIDLPKTVMGHFAGFL